MVLDLDLQFEVDINDLYQHFDVMDQNNNILAMANDLAPHYWFHFQKYAKKNKSPLNPNFQVIRFSTFSGHTVDDKSMK